jgi:hypothetical protein
MRKTAARPGRLFIHPSHNSFKLGCLRHRAMCSSSYRPVPDFPCRRVTVTLSYPIIYLTMFIDSFGFWTWRTLFCPIRLSPHRPTIDVLKALRTTCIQQIVFSTGIVHQCRHRLSTITDGSFSKEPPSSYTIVLFGQVKILKESNWAHSVLKLSQLFSAASATRMPSFLAVSIPKVS